MLEKEGLRERVLLENGMDRLIQARRIVVRPGGISRKRNGLKYIKTKMWTAERAWRGAMRRRSSETKALRDWALKEGLEEYDLNVRRRTRNTLNESQRGKKYSRQETLK